MIQLMRQEAAKIREVPGYSTKQSWVSQAITMPISAPQVYSLWVRSCRDAQSANAGGKR